MQAFTRWFQKQSTWIESQQATILSAAFIILIANVASAVFGLVKNRVLLSAYVDMGGLIDSYWVAFRLPEFIFQLIVLGTVSAAFVPLFSKLHKEDQDEAFGLARQIMLVLLSIFVLSGVVVFFFAPQFIALLTGPEFTAEQTELAIGLTRIMLIAQLFFAISGFMSAMLQSLKRFIVPAFSPVFYNLGIILFVWLFSEQMGLYAAAWGTVFGAFLHFVIQLPLLKKCGFQLFGGFHWRPGKLKELFLLAGPRTIAMVIEQMNLWVVTFLATSIGGISLTLITVAQQLMSIPIRFFGVSIAQASLPFFAANAHDEVGFRTMVYRSLRQIAFFSIPASTLLLILRVAIVRLAYGVEELPWRATLDTAAVLGILSISIAAQACTLLFVRAFYAMNNTVVPFFASVTYFLATVILGWYLVLVQGMGLTGIALSLTIAGLLEMFILLLIFLIKQRFHGFGQFSWAMGRIIGASLLMALTLFIFQRLFDLYVFETSRVLQLVVLTLIVGTLGCVVYVTFCWLLKIEELTILSRIFHKLRSQWNKVVGNTPDFVESVSPGEQAS